MADSRFRSLPSRNVIADEVYLRLKALIMESSIPPGTRINIEDVSRELAVSPTPVRESLARLESDGLVDKLPLKGYRTTQLLTEEELRELYELRLLLEPNAARHAAAAVDDEGRRRLAAEIETGRSSPSGSESTSYAELSNHDARLHDLIFELAGNATIRQVFARTHCHLHTFRLSYSGTFGEHTVDEHEAITDAIASGGVDEAEAAMRVHLLASRERVLGGYDRSVED